MRCTRSGRRVEVKRSRIVHRAGAIALMLILGMSVAARGAGLQVYWDINNTTAGAGGATPDGAWSTVDANWNTSPAGGAGTLAGWDNANGNDAIFSAGSDATGLYTATLGEAISANSVFFKDGSATVGGAFTLTVGAGGISATATAAGTVNSNVTMGAAQTWLNTSTAALTIGGAVDNGSFDLSVDGSGATIIGGALGGGGGLSKSGTGTLTLSGPNTFGGAATISLNQGKMNINSSTALGASGNTFVINGGTIDNTFGSPIILANSYAQTWAGDFTFAGSNDLNLGTGAVTLGANRQVTVSAGTLSVGGAIGGAFRLTKAGAGALTLVGGSTYTALTVSGGTVNFASDTALGAAPAVATPDSVILNGGTLNGTGIGFTINSFRGIQIGPGGGSLLNNAASGNNFTYNGVFADLGTPGALTLGGSGASPTVLGGQSTFSGGMILSGTGSQVVVITIDSTGPAGAMVNGPFGTGTLTFNGGQLRTTTGGPHSVANAINFQADTTIPFFTPATSMTFTGPVTLTGGTRTFTNATTTASGATVFSGAIGGAQSFIKAGVGIVDLKGPNTFGGAGKSLTLAAGTLKLGNASALGDPANTFIITSGTIDNSFGASLQLASPYAQNWNGAFAFTGTNSLDMNSGPVTLGTSPIVTVTANTLTVGGSISGTGFGLFKAGNGVLELNSAASTYDGGTVVNAGTVSITADGGLGAVGGALTLNGGGVRIAGTTNTAWNNSRTLNLTGAATIDIASAANTYTLGLPSVTPGGAFTKAGVGTLALPNAFTSTNAVTVNNGTLKVSNAFTLTTATGTFTLGNTANQSAVLNIDNANSNVSFFQSFNGGTVANAVGVINLSAGQLNRTDVGTTDTFNIAGLGYGYLNVSGGTLTANKRLNLANIGGGVGVGMISGGTVNVYEFLGLARSGVNTVSALTMTGGTINHLALGGGAASNHVGVVWQNTGEVGVLNMAGGLLDSSGTNIQGGGGNPSTSSATVNLNAGTVKANGVLAVPGTGSNNAMTVNFNGGTLMATVASANFVGMSTNTGTANTITEIVNGAFGTYAGGAVINTNGFAATISQPLLAPQGNGVFSVDVTAGGTGYVGAPSVSITGGGGTGATGYATINSAGAVTGIVITNPGQNYTSTPTIALSGGGGTGATFGTIGIAATTSGGLTKSGAGVLTLSGANTFTGGIVINGGGLTLTNSNLASGVTINNSSALTIGSGGSISASNVVLNSGTLTIASGGVFGASGLAATPGRWLLESAGGSILLDSPAAIGALTTSVHGSAAGDLAVTSGGQNVDLSPSAANLPLAFLGASGTVTYTGTYTPNVAGVYRFGGTGNLIYSPTLAGSNSVLIGGGGGTVVLGGINTHTGGTTVSNGTLRIDASNGAAGLGAGPLNLAGGTVQWGTGAAGDISSVPVNLVSGTNTFDTGANTVTLANGIGSAGAGGLTKIGAGTLILAGANNFTGATAITAGVLQLGHLNALKSSALTVSVANSLAFSSGVGTVNVGSLTGAGAIALADVGSNPVTLAVGFNNVATSYTGVLSGSGGLTKIGSGILTLANNAGESYTGATTIAGSSTSAAAGGLLLDFSNAAFTTLTSNIISPSSALVMGGTFGNGTLNIKGKAAGTDSQAFASTTLNQGYNYINFTQNTAASLSANLGAITRTTAGAVDFFLPTAGSVQASGTLTNGILGAWATTSTGGTAAGAAVDFATLSGGNVVAYTGYTSIASGLVGATDGSTAANNVKSAGTTFTFGAVAADVTDINTFLYSNATTVGTLNVGAGGATSVLRFGAGGGILVAGITGAKALTVGSAANSGIITAGGAANTPGELILNTGSTTANSLTLTVNSTIADNGSGAVTLVKTGNSQLTLAGTNTYTGGTYVEAGRILVNAVTGALGRNAANTAGGDVTINMGGQVVIVGGTWDNKWFLSGNGTNENAAFGALRIDGSANLTGTVTLVNDATIGNFNAPGTISGKITGPGTLLRTNALNGLLTISNPANDYAGGTIVSAGTIQFNSAGAMGAGNVTLLNGILSANFTGTQAVIKSKVNPNATGTLALTATSAAENLDFSAAGMNQPNLFLGATGTALTYTGIYTPAVPGVYRFGGGPAASVLTYAQNITGANTSVIIGGAGSGAVNLTGTGNTFGGGLILTGITLQLTDLSTLGTGGFTVTGTSTLQYGSLVTTDISTKSITIATSANLSIDTNGNNVSFANVIGNGNLGSITKTGTGTLTLNGANNYLSTTNFTTISGGTLLINTPTALYPNAGLVLGNTTGNIAKLGASITTGSISGGGTTAGTIDVGAFNLTAGLANTGGTYVGTISGTTGSYTQTGGGTLALNPRSAFTYTGATSANGGGIVVDFSTTNTTVLTNPFSTSSALNFGGGNLTFTGRASTTSSQAFASTTINPGQGGLSLTNNATANPLSVDLKAITRNPGGTLNAANPANGALSATNGIQTATLNTDFTAAGGQLSIIGGYFTIGLNTWATSANSGASNFITGLAAYNPGFAAGKDVDAPIGASAPGAMAINSLRFNTAGAASVDATGGLTIASGGILITSTVANGVSFNNGTLASGNGQDLIVINNNVTGATGAVTINSQITGGAAMALTKSGPGTLVLGNAANSYGKTFLNNGIMQVASAGALGSGDITISNNSGAAGEARLEFTAAGLVIGNNIINNNVHPSGLAQGIVYYNGPAGGFVTLNGAMTVTQNVMGGGQLGSAQSTGGFIVNGALNVPLGVTYTDRSGTNTYSGGGTVYSMSKAADTIKIGANNGLSTAAVLTLGSLAATTFDLSGFNQSLIGLVNTGANAATITNSGAQATLTLTPPAGAVYSVSSLGIITGNLNLTLSGGGTQNLAGASSYTGTNTVTSGTLQAGGGTALGSMSNTLNMSGGIVDINGQGGLSIGALTGTGGTITDNAAAAGGEALSAAGSASAAFAGVIANGPSRILSFTKGGSGTQTLSGINTYSGLTAVAGGKLQVLGSIASSSAVTISSGATFDAGATQTVKSLIVQNGGSAEISGAALKVLTVNALSIAGPTGNVNLHSNAMVVDYSGASPLNDASPTGIRAAILSAYHGGDWLGKGIGSSEIAASVGSSKRLAVGYVEASSLLGAGGGTWNLGQSVSSTVDGTAILVRTTLAGDADMSGDVGLNDLLRLANHYGLATAPTTAWYDGDFDYSGDVGLNDLLQLANNYGQAMPASAIPSSSPQFAADMQLVFELAGQGVTSVPEPTGLGLAALAAAIGLLRRNRARGGKAA